MISTVLFVSDLNAGRTQMATAWLNALAHPDKVRAASAGTNPASAVVPEVIEMMKEVSLDLSPSQPQLLTPLLRDSADLIVVIMPPLLEGNIRGGGEYDEWVVDDLVGEPLDHVRKIRDDVEKMVRRLRRPPLDALRGEHSAEQVTRRPQATERSHEKSPRGTESASVDRISRQPRALLARPGLPLAHRPTARPG